MQVTASFLPSCKVPTCKSSIWLFYEPILPESFCIWHWPPVIHGRPIQGRELLLLLCDIFSRLDRWWFCIFIFLPIFSELLDNLGFLSYKGMDKLCGITITPRFWCIKKLYNFYVLLIVFRYIALLDLLFKNCKLYTILFIAKEMWNPKEVIYQVSVKAIQKSKTSEWGTTAIFALSLLSCLQGP